jgi:chlorobactene glucosyltransferase
VTSTQLAPASVAKEPLNWTSLEPNGCEIGLPGGGKAVAAIPGLAVAWLAVVAWLIFRVSRQVLLLREIAAAVPPQAGLAPGVALIVPARDEEANIGRCLRSLAGQDYPAERLKVLVIDDHSADGTAAVATQFARQHAFFRVLRAPPLPPGWVGKSHACWVGARAVGGEAEWLCFIDADTFAEPYLISSAVAAATRESIDLLSLAPRHELKSFAERLIIPCGLCLLGFCQDLHKVQARRGTKVTATGQFMLVRRCAYERAGGHAAIHGAICEDVALARRIKHDGGHVLLLDGASLISTRMYTGWRTLWPGFAKNISDMLGGVRATLAIALAAVTLAWAALFIPLAAAASCMHGQGCMAVIPAVAGSAAAFGLHIAAAVHLGIPFWYGLLFAPGYTVGALMAIDSVRRRWRGRVSWKGRLYP